MLAPIHILASTLSLDNAETEMCKIIKKTRQCLEGTICEEEANQVAKTLMKYCNKRWPRYNQSGTLKQEDAAEFLTRLFKDEKNIGSQVETITAQATTCSNEKCSLRQQEQLLQEHINLINISNYRQITLQQIVDNISYRNKATRCHKCKALGTDSKMILKAPKHLIIQVTRGSQITEVRNPTGAVEINENEKTVRYKVTGVIIHKGEVTRLKSNGHYTCNIYNEAQERYIQIDDHAISVCDDVMMEENTQGSIYFLKKDPYQTSDITRPIVRLNPSQLPVTLNYCLPSREEISPDHVEIEETKCNSTLNSTTLSPEAVMETEREELRNTLLEKSQIQTREQDGSNLTTQTQATDIDATQATALDVPTHERDKTQESCNKATTPPAADKETEEKELQSTSQERWQADSTISKSQTNTRKPMTHDSSTGTPTIAVNTAEDTALDEPIRDQVIIQESCISPSNQPPTYHNPTKGEDMQSTSYMEWNGDSMTFKRQTHTVGQLQATEVKDLEEPASHNWSTTRPIILTNPVPNPEVSVEMKNDRETQSTSPVSSTLISAEVEETGQQDTTEMHRHGETILPWCPPKPTLPSQKLQSPTTHTEQSQLITHQLTAPLHITPSPPAHATTQSQPPNTQIQAITPLMSIIFTPQTISQIKSHLNQRQTCTVGQLQVTDIAELEEPTSHNWSITKPIILTDTMPNPEVLVEMKNYRDTQSTSPVPGTLSSAAVVETCKEDTTDKQWHGETMIWQNRKYITEPSRETGLGTTEKSQNPDSHSDTTSKQDENCRPRQNEEHTQNSLRHLNPEAEEIADRRDSRALSTSPSDTLTIHTQKVDSEPDLVELEVTVTKHAGTKVLELPSKAPVQKRPVTVSKVTEEIKIDPLALEETTETNEEVQDTSYSDRLDEELIFLRSNISPSDGDSRALITAERLAVTTTPINTVSSDTITTDSETEADIRELNSSYWYGETLNFRNTARKHKTAAVSNKRYYVDQDDSLSLRTTRGGYAGGTYAVCVNLEATVIIIIIPIKTMVIKMIKGFIQIQSSMKAQYMTRNKSPTTMHHFTRTN